MVDALQPAEEVIFNAAHASDSAINKRKLHSVRLL